MNKSGKLVLCGDSAFAEVAYECFTRDSEYEVVGFAVEQHCRKRSKLFGLPVVDMETVENHFPPEQHDMYVAAVYGELNRLRKRLMELARQKGYALANYISTRAFVWPNVLLGEHCFIFEDNTIQPFVKIGNNVVLWSGNHIGHHATIGDHVFISSHVVVAGSVEVGEYCFLGVNSTLVNDVRIAKDCWVGPGVVIARDTKAGQLFKPTQPDIAGVSTYRYFRIRE